MMKHAFILAAAALLASFSTSFAFQEETEYTSSGRWRVMTISDQGRFQYCAADTDNGQVQLRIGTDGSRWQLGVPYYDNGPVRGQWGFDGWEDDAMFQTHGDGWAVMDVNQHVLDSLYQMGNFSIELDRGPQHFDLGGSSNALDQVLECARNAGRPQAGGLDWVTGHAGQPPDPRAVAVGAMPDGLPVFVCVGNYNGGAHPGMAGMWIEGCSIGYGGREITVRDFSMMIGTGNWVRAANGQVPANAVQAGNEANGDPLYVCRARSQGAVFAGKIRPGFNGCNVGDTGREQSFPSYDVLTF